MLTHKTTKEHYGKFKGMAKIAGITFKNSTEPLGYDKKRLLELYIEDEHLNNIPLHVFDSYYSFYISASTKKYIKSSADNTCVLKHLIIYEVLGATPHFSGEVKI